MKLEELYQRSMHIVDEHRARSKPLIVSANEAPAGDENRLEEAEEAVEVLG